MIRGIERIVRCGEVTPGRFYLMHDHRGPMLFQCVRTGEAIDDGFKNQALYFTTGSKPEFGLYDLPSRVPLVELGDVHVRVDPTSLAHSAFTTSPASEMLVVDGGSAIFFAPTSFRGYRAVDITNGHTLESPLGHDWLSFARWWLVMDDSDGEELTIASFGSDMVQSQLVSE